MAVPKRWLSVSSIVKIGTVLGGVVLGCVLIGFLGRGRSGPHPVREAQSLNQPAVDFAAFLVEDDIQTALSGEKSVMSSNSDDTLIDWAALDERTTAKKYEAAYDDNEISADNRFKGRKLLLSGIIASVEKDFTGQGYLTLQGSNPFLGVHAQLSDHSMAEAATFKRGQEVRLVCEGGGRMATVAMLDHCEPLKDYIDKISSTIKSRVTQFLSGKVALNQQDANTLTLGYVIAESMPSNSRCLAGDRATCATEMEVVLQDKARAASIRERMTKLIASLKVAPQ